MSVLQEELEYYISQLSEWLNYYEGHYALIKGKKLVGTFTTPEEAYRDGVSKFGNVPFLIKKIERIERLEQLPALTLGLICAHI
ncbi:MAG: hypothetical protein K8I29_19660 [Alphaproteobacteria bacterium]|uniref:DUF5678 domain-containing protein n=1 Tax=Candidatus Nitrobium versatile TaxID=2884831 RepID=A0A953M3V9_9BACT|nr:hypothetical protein [Candidatus Nitrobium versatile]